MSEWFFPVYSEAKNKEKSNIESISYPGGKSSNAITTLKHQVDNAKSLDEIARLNENNEKIKEAVKKVVEAINKLSNSNNKKEQLKNELNSTISIDGEKWNKGYNIKSSSGT
ncbi:hypothetical protein [Mycoplasmopsis cynos]|uniref:hypothetical protein n=1 Tax=Mycoplasmopsis cynos TaxID=171284 RepID=UPI0021F93F16|nr:hypothetical protein [Mycoplasmopsis cynos]UWV77591.1 hypothetical protein NW070_01480 [Mycoplasmopsis cynos]